MTIETGLIGIWKLLTLETEFQDGSPRRPVYGENPSGYIIFTTQGRMMVVIEGEGRRSAKTDGERAALFRTMSAHTGIYRLEGDKWITTVDVAWTPDRRGTNQIRFYRLDGNRLEVTSAWAPDVNIPGAPITRNVMTWERA